MTKPSFFQSILTAIPAFIVSASISHAATEHTCKIEGGTPIKFLEEFKHDLMTSNAKSLQPYFFAPAQEAALRVALEQYRSIVGKGKVSCMTLLQRIDDGGLTQEVSSLKPAGSPVVIFLYTLSYPMQDRAHALHYFHFSTDLSEALKMVR